MSDRYSLLKRTGSILLLLIAISGLLVSATESAHAQTYSVLHNFCSQPNCVDGYYAGENLLVDKNGNLFGTTEVGGAAPPSCNGFPPGAAARSLN